MLSWQKAGYARPPSRASFSASIAAPRAPAVSPLGITWMGIPACSPLGRHGTPDLLDKPILKLLASFERASAHDECVGIERVHHLIEEQTQRVRLHAENFPAQGIALLRQAAHQFGCLVDVHPGQFMTGIARQKIGQDIFFDGSE